ncbi:unnamed protein product, partial [Ectocarpus sp. 12 AP-2014]
MPATLKHSANPDIIHSSPCKTKAGKGGGIAGTRRKNARNTTKPVSADILERRSRCQEKRQAKAVRKRQSLAAQPRAEHGSFLHTTTATADIGGSGNAEPTAVIETTLNKPGRSTDPAISALRRALRAGGGGGATKVGGSAPVSGEEAELPSLATVSAADGPSSS